VVKSNIEPFNKAEPTLSFNRSMFIIIVRCHSNHRIVTRSNSSEEGRLPNGGLLQMWALRSKYGFRGHQSFFDWCKLYYDLYSLNTFCLRSCYSNECHQQDAFVYVQPSTCLPRHRRRPALCKQVKRCHIFNFTNCNSSLKYIWAIGTKQHM